MNGDRIDIFNLLLLVLSLLIAILLPFETFLFAYAVLGPLHYLTEINWLNNRNFFSREKKHIWILIFLTVLISIPTLTYGRFALADKGLIHKIVRPISLEYSDIIFISFLTAIGLVFLRKWSQLIPLLTFGLGITYFLRAIPFFSIIIGVFLPTLIHVYFFTLAFMLLGIFRSKSKVGIVTFTLALLCPLLIFILPWELSLSMINNSMINKYLENGFQDVNVTLANFFTSEGTSAEMLIVSKVGIKIQTFIAFAYLYHYLNWFSKISVIGWLKNTSGKKLSLIGGAWCISVFLYYFDYQLGLTVLFFMSLLHVILEFPLNIICMRELFSSVKRLSFNLIQRSHVNNYNFRRKTGT